jgi:hypothetical protein
MNECLPTMIPEKVGEASMETAAEFLAYHGVTPDKLDTVSRQEWLQAINFATNPHNNELPAEPTPTIEVNYPEVEEEEVEFKEVANLAEFKMP